MKIQIEWKEGMVDDDHGTMSTIILMMGDRNGEKDRNKMKGEQEQRGQRKNEM